MDSYIEIAARLILSCILGGAVGIERESIHRPAGLRTHVLVSLGSALFTLVSIHGFGGNNNVTDPSRVAAQIVSGIGFLGAGTIIRHRAGIRGLTTAASLWTVAGIGLGVGSGYYAGSVIATTLVLVSLIMLRKIEGWLSEGKRFRHLTLSFKTSLKVSQVTGMLSAFDIEIKEMEYDTNQDEQMLHMTVRVPNELDTHVFFEKLMEAGVHKSEWDD